MSSTDTSALVLPSVAIPATPPEQPERRATPGIGATPVQTITFTIDLLRAKDPRLGPALDRLARASRTLAEFSHALTRHRDAHTWSPGEESLEAATKVEQLFGSRNVDRQSPRSSAGELMRRQGRRGRL